MADPRGGLWLNACAAHARKLGLEQLGSGLGAYLMTSAEVPWEVYDSVFLNDLADLWSRPVSEVHWVRVLDSLGFGATESGLMGRVCGRTSVRAEKVGTLLRLVATERDPYLLLPQITHIAVPANISETLMRYVIHVLLDEYRAPDDPLLKIPVHTCEQLVRDALATKGWPRRLWDELGGENALMPGLLMATAVAGYHSPSSIRWAAGQVAKKSRDDDLLTQLCLRGGDVTTAVDAAENEHLTPAGMKRVIATAAPAVIEALVKRHDVPLEVVETAALRTLVDVTHIGSVYALLANPATPAAHVPALIERAWLIGGDDRAYVASLVRDLDADRRHTIWEGLLARSRPGKATSEMLKVMLWSDETAADTMDAQTVDHAEMNWLTTGTHPRGGLCVVGSRTTVWLSGAMRALSQQRTRLRMAWTRKVRLACTDDPR
ncbi:hypothetical protein GCM10011366_04540 [Ornithinimicrobium tianjinense]|uniref:Uncharacterized protein n=2 Tax=Ornithinimicrobium tianjinense TaxID=1195761 RepID=A0A917BHZ1_9MICO|nr:hypothetical protein GCM10011366_04540 [Ornithinimicrobium tianjinense]